MVNNTEVNKVADIKVNNNKGEIKMVTKEQIQQVITDVQEQSKIEGVAVERELIHLVVGNQEFKVIASDEKLIYKSGEWGEVEIVEVNDEEIEFQEYYEMYYFTEYYEDIEDLSVGYILGVLESMGYVVQEQSTSEEEVEMVNNNNEVIVDEVVNNGVNNNKQGEMKMVNNNDEWIERVEAYVEVKNARTLASLIYDGTLGKDSWERFTGETVEVEEDIQVGGDWLITISKVDNLTIGNNPDIKKGLRVYVQNKGDIIEKALYVAVDEDGVIGQEDVIYEMRSYEDVVEAAVNKAGTFIKDWMYYFKVDVSGIGLDDSIKFCKDFPSSKKDSYDTLYTETVEWLMGKIKWTRELEAKQDEDRVYDVDWELYYLDCYEMPEVRVADDLNANHDYYDSLYLSVDDYEMYKELDEAYGVLEDFKENPAKYVKDDWYSSGDWAEEFNYWAKEVYKEFISRFNNEYVVVLSRGLEDGSYTDDLFKIIRKLVAKNMYYYQSSYNEILETVEETESGIYLTVSYGGFSKTIKVDDINYTNHDVLCAVYELGYVIDVAY